MSDIVEKGHVITSCVAEAINKVTEEWGVTVEHVHIRDVRLPIDMVQSMAKEAVMTRETNAKVCGFRILLLNPFFLLFLMWLVDPNIFNTHQSIRELNEILR